MALEKMSEWTSSIRLSRSSSITDRSFLRDEIYGTDKDDDRQRYQECYLVWGYGRRGTDILKSILIALSILGVGFQVAVLLVRLDPQGILQAWLPTFLPSIIFLSMVTICLLISIFRTRVSIYPTLAATYKLPPDSHIILYRSNRIKYVVISLLMALNGGLIMIGLSLDGWNNRQVAAIIPAAILMTFIIIFVTTCEPRTSRCCKSDLPMYNGLI